MCKCGKQQGDYYLVKVSKEAVEKRDAQQIANEVFDFLDPELKNIIKGRYSSYEVHS